MSVGVFSFSLIWESIAAQFLTFVPHGEQTLVEKDSPSSRTTKSSFFSRSAHFGNVSSFLVRATNTFSQLIPPGSFGFLPLRGAGTGFLVLLPLPRTIDPPLCILHFTIYTIFHREVTLKTALELLDYSVKIRSQVQTITSAILPRNQSPSVSNSQRRGSCEQTFDSSTIPFEPPWSE